MSSVSNNSAVNGIAKNKREPDSGVATSPEAETGVTLPHYLHPARATISLSKLEDGETGAEPAERANGESTTMSSGTVLVTGAGGYVASHCIVELLNEGFDVIAFDNFANTMKVSGEMPESLTRIQGLTGKKIIFEKVDLCDLEALRNAVKKYEFDCVLHAAAYKSVGESCAQPLMYYGNNVIGSYNLLKAMDEVSVKKIVFSSSSTVYGTPNYLPMDENHPVGTCTNPYGKTKFFVEEMCKDLCLKDKEWGTMLLRYFNPIGAHPSGVIGEDPLGVPYNLMPYIAQVAVGRREKLTIFGNDYSTRDGTAIRDYVHVMDVASGHVTAVKALLAKGFSGAKIYNLGIGAGATVYEVIAAFEEATGLKVPTELAGRRAGDVEASYASCDLIEKELGWKANLTLKDMCRDMWTWQSKNPSGYRKKEDAVDYF